MKIKKSWLKTEIEVTLEELENFMLRIPDGGDFYCWLIKWIKTNF